MEKGGVEAMVHRVPVLGPRLVVTVVSGGAMMCGDGGAGGGRGKERMGAPIVIGHRFIQSSTFFAAAMLTY